MNAVASSWEFETRDFKERWLDLFHKRCGKTTMKDASKINMNQINIFNIQESFKKQKAQGEYAIVDGMAVPVDTGSFNVSIQYKQNSMEMHVVDSLDFHVVSSYS